MEMAFRVRCRGMPPILPERKPFEEILGLAILSNPHDFGKSLVYCDILITWERIRYIAKEYSYPDFEMRKCSSGFFVAVLTPSIVGCMVRRFSSMFARQLV